MRKGQNQIVYVNCINVPILLKVLVELDCNNKPGKINVLISWQRFGATEIVRNINFTENYEVSCTFIYVCMLSILISLP